MIEDKKLTIKNSDAEFLVFEKSDTENGIEVRYEDETLWMTQKSMSALFDVQVPTVNEHLKNVFSEGELEENSVIRNFRITAADGKSYNTIPSENTFAKGYSDSQKASGHYVQRRY